VFGLASTGVLATGGLLVLPRRRRVLRAEIRARVSSLRSRLEKELQNRVGQHMDMHAERVRAAVDPFASFASTRAVATEAQLVALTGSLHGLRAVALDVPLSKVTTASKRPRAKT
jgi:FPC/CPF motif-containing protein YcgG